MIIALFLLLPAVVASQVSVGNPVLAARIVELFRTVVLEDDSQGAAADAEARRLFASHGLLTIDDVGDEAAYTFVVLLCMEGADRERADVLSKARKAVARHVLAADAAAFCDARRRFDALKTRAARRPPTHPDLRDQLQRMLAVDRDGRQPEHFDATKMQAIDREHAAALDAIVSRYGVPTYAMVGSDGVTAFVTMVQHQPPAIRRKVLPMLKAAVDAGQADPGDYTKVFDRTAHDDGRAQLYGENLECGPGETTLHRGPIDDEARVNARRAAMGLVRLEIYERIVIATSPAMCGARPRSTIQSSRPGPAAG
jgi:hypothetical protein